MLSGQYSWTVNPESPSTTYWASVGSWSRRGSIARMDCMSNRLRIDVPVEKIAEFCRRHHVRKLAFFGSVLRDDFRPDSDVDVLVEFEPGQTPGLAFFGMQDELSDLLGRRVDLNTPGCLSPHFRNRVAQEAETLYDAA